MQFLNSKMDEEEEFKGTNMAAFQQGRKPYNNNHNNGEKEELKTLHCDCLCPKSKPGHTTENCWKLHPEKRRTWPRGRGSEKKEERQPRGTPNIIKAGQNFVGMTVRKGVIERVERVNLNEKTEPDSRENFNMSMTTEKISKNDVIVSSGCSQCCFNVTR